MAHIRKRGKKYSVIIELEKSSEGRRRQKYIGTYVSKKKAEEVLLSTENARLNNTYIAENKILFNDYVEEYFNQEITKRAKTTQNDYRILIEKYIKKYFDNMRLQAISVVNIQDYFNNYIRDLNPKTVRKHYAVLNGVFTRAFKSELITKNLCDYVTLPKVEQREVVRLELEEIRNILEKSKESNFNLEINLAINLGLRLGEILGLKWEDVNFKKNTIDINRSFNVVNGEPLLKEPKTKSGKRQLASNKEIMDLLHKELLRQKQERLKDKDFNELNLVCVNRDGRYVNPRTLSKEFSNWLKKIGFKHIRFHDLRHANATLMLLGGVQPKVASKRLGHSKISTTMDIYTDVLKELDVDVAEKLESILYKKQS